MQRLLTRFAAGLCALCLLLPAGCGAPREEEPPSPFPVRVGEITLYGEPESIVSLSDDITACLEELGFSEQIAAVNEGCALEAFAGLPTVGTETLPDAEAIVELGPDLVVTAFPVPTQATADLSAAGIKLLVLEEDASTYPETLARLRGDPAALAGSSSAA